MKKFKENLQSFVFYIILIGIFAPIIVIDMIERLVNWFKRTFRKEREIDFRSLIENSRGKFFTVQFIKKDGSLRVMNCKYHKSQTRATDNTIIVEDMALKRKSPSYIRTITISNIVNLSINGVNYRRGK